MTEDQKYCKEMLSEWVGGDHHLPKVHEFGTGICINFYGDLSTYDWNRLTRLVLLAHRDAVRVEISWSGPRMVKIIAHRRSRDGDRIYNRHPSLADLIKEAQAMIESDETTPTPPAQSPPHGNDSGTSPVSSPSPG